MGILLISCKQCGQTFSSGIAVGLAGKPILGDHLHGCPHCGARNHYHSDDYVETSTP